MTSLSTTQIILSSLPPTKNPSKTLSPPKPSLLFAHSTTTPSLSLTHKRALPIITNAKANPTGEQKWTHEGSVTESLPNGMFRVKLDNQDLIIGYISGKIRKNFVRILPGDRVKVEVSRYDSSRGRIVYRLRNNRDTGGD